MTDDDDAVYAGDLLERSIGSGPPGLPTPTDRLAVGRRAAPTTSAHHSGDQLGIGEGTVKRNASRGLASLQRVLAQA